MDSKMTVQYVPIGKIKPYERNPRRNDQAVDKVAASIREFGFQQPIVCDMDGVIIVGHTRLKAAKKLGMDTVPVVYADLPEDKAKAYRLADNKTGEFAEWDFDLLDLELGDIEMDMEPFGFEITNRQKDGSIIPEALRKEFIAPPFSVLDARSGEWQKRKKLWNEVLCSEKGREGDLIGAGYKGLAEKSGMKSVCGTSIFDPCLTEILVHWFCPVGGKIIDPFAGGSVRGIVSNLLGRDYYGNDLSESQIQENKKQAEKIIGEKDFYGKNFNMPRWSVGDSAEIENIIAESNFDMLLTCPPYFDLEVYSKKENDLSNMDYDGFLRAYKLIIKKTSAKLKPNSFACIVVGEIRDKKGIYRNFIGDTIEAAKEAGLKYYNELILVTMLSTAPMRARKIFKSQRKICNTHQKALIFLKDPGDAEMVETIKSFDRYRDAIETKESILVFLKGDPKEAAFPIEKYTFEKF